MSAAAAPASGSTRARSSRAAGIALVVAAALIWSTGGLIVRLLSGLDSWTIVFWRSLAAFSFLICFGLFSQGAGFLRDVARMRLPGLAIALCYVVASISLVAALQLTTVADVLVLMSCAPLLAALLARIVLKEKLGHVGWIALAASVLGAGAMVSDSYAHGSIAGDLIAIAMTFAQAVAIVLFRSNSGSSMIPGVSLAMLLAAAAAAPLASFAPLSWPEAGLILLFGAGQLGLGLALFATGARLIPAAETAMFGVLEPVIGPIWVWLALDEKPTGMALLGGAVVIAALLLFTLSQLRAMSSTSARN